MPHMFFHLRVLCDPAQVWLGRVVGSFVFGPNDLVGIIDENLIDYNIHQPDRDLHICCFSNGFKLIGWVQIGDNVSILPVHSNLTRVDFVAGSIKQIVGEGGEFKGTLY